MAQYSSTAVRRLPAIGPTQPVPMYPKRNSEISSEAALSTRPAPDPPLSNPPPPYPPAETALRRLSCSHTATPRIRYTRLPQNISNTQSSYLPNPRAALVLESSLQN